MKESNKVRMAGSPFASTAYVVNSKPIAFEHEVSIYGSIEEAIDFEEIIMVLNDASANDSVVMHVNSGGGALDATLSLLHAMEGTEANVTVIAEGTVASAATLILLAANGIEVGRHTEFMFHAASYGTRGKQSDISDYVKHVDKHLISVMTAYYEGFFTKRELKKLFEGKEYWMGSDEFIERLGKRRELLSAAMEAAGAGEK